MTDEEFERVMATPSRSFFAAMQGSVGHTAQCFSAPPAAHHQLPLSNPVAPPPSIPCSALAGVQAERQVNSEPTPVVASAPVIANGGKKRAAKKPAKKPAKKAKKVVELSDDDEDDDDGAGCTRWTDPETIQLIAFRSEMDEEFERNAKKQGVSTWDKLQARMVVACQNFSKSAEACRKKWKVIYRQYNTDKRILQVSREGRKVTCKYFDEIDQGFNNRANVRKFTHGDARGSTNPCPIDLNVVEEGQGSGGSDQPSVYIPDEWIISIKTFKITEVHWDDSPKLPNRGPIPDALYYPPEMLAELNSSSVKPCTE